MGMCSACFWGAFGSQSQTIPFDSTQSRFPSPPPIPSPPASSAMDAGMDGWMDGCEHVYVDEVHPWTTDNAVYTMLWSPRRHREDLSILGLIRAASHGSQALFKIEVFNALQMRCGPSTYTVGY